MTTALVIIACVIIIAVPSLVVAYYLSKPQSELQCIAFESENEFKNVREMLNEAGIHGNLRMSSPSQEAYNSLGTAGKSPMELWIHRSDYERIKSILQSKYLIEVNPTAVIVKTKAP